MKRATVRDLRFRFREVEDLLREGQEIQITKRRRVIAKLMPCPPAPPPHRPDFLARLQTMYGNTPLKVSGAELIARERADFERLCRYTVPRCSARRLRFGSPR